MRRQEYPGCPAILTGVIVSNKYGLAPFPNLWTIARRRSVRAGVGSGWVKLSGNHSGPAFVGAKDVGVSTLRHLFNFRRVTLKLSFTKGASQNRLNDLKSFIGTFYRAVVTFRQYPGIDNLKLIPAVKAVDHLAIVLRFTLNRAIVVMLYPARHSCPFSIGFAAILTGQPDGGRLTGAPFGATNLSFIKGVKLLIAPWTNLNHS